MYQICRYILAQKKEMRGIDELDYLPTCYLDHIERIYMMRAVNGIKTETNYRVVIEIIDVKYATL
jgi:hypothetical protein